MPIYEVTAPNGKIYEIEGPAGASQQELIQATQRYIRQQEAAAAQARLSAAQAALAQAQTEPPKTTAFGHVKEAIKGPVSGLIGLGEIFAAGISSLLPEETEKAARKKIEEIAGVAKAPYAAAPGYEESIPRRLFEGIGSTVPFFLLGPLGLAGRLAAGGIGVAAGAGEARLRAEAEGATPEERRLATQLGAPTGLLDLLAPSIGPIKNIVTTALARGGVEGATEAAQQVSQNLIARGVYDPSQPIFAGAGEEGAYGAGVGALTSLILDLAIPGRRAAYRPKPEPTPTPTPTPTPEGVPSDLREAPPTAPTAVPTPTEAAPYEAGLEPADIARADRQAALQETFDQGQAYPPGPLFPEEPTLYGPRTEEEFQLTPPERDVQAERQLELPLETAVEPARQDTRQPDLPGIEDATVTARAMERARERKPLTTPPIIGEVEQAPSARPEVELDFLRQRQEAGLPLTPAESLRLREAEKAAPIPELALPTQEPAPTAPLEVVQRPERQVPPLQLTGAEVPKPLVEPTPEPVAAEPAAPTLLSPEVLDRTGLPKQSGFYKQLVGKDMTDPGQVAQAQALLPQIEANPNVPAPIKQAVSALIPTQQEMFGPRGGVLPTAVPKKGKQVEPTGVVPRGVGVSPAVSVPAGERAKPAQPRPAAAPAAKAPKRDRLAVRKEPARPAVSRKEPKPSALEEPKAKPAPSISKQEARNRLRQAGYDPQEAAQLIKDNTDSTTGEVDAQAINEATSSFSKLNKDEVKLVQPLGDDVIAQLKTNDVSGALDTLAKQTQGELGRIARALSRELRRAKIEVIMADFKKPPPLVERLFEREPDGKNASGFYATSSAGKRYLVLDTNTGLDAWTLMHESTHAATDATLNNESHPMTVQLTKLYKEVEPLLGTVYGARNVKEFAAEAFSNKSFRQQLAAISIDKKPVNALQRFVNIVSNYVRRLLGKPAKTPESALDVADNLINKIIATNHGDAGVGSLYRASFLNKGDQVLNAVAQRRAQYRRFGNWWVDTAKDAFAGARRPTKKLVMSALEAPQLADLAKADLPMAPEFGKIVNAQNNETAEYVERIAATEQAVNQQIQKLTPAQLETLKYLVVKSTTLQVDPSVDVKEYKGVVDPDGVDKEAVWKEMQSDWKSVGETGRAVYTQVRNAYSRLRVLQQEAYDAVIDGAVPDKGEAKKVKADFRELLKKHGYIQPYFALNRSDGPYRLYFEAISPFTGKPDVGVKHFNSPQERERGIQELLSDKDLNVSNVRRFEELTIGDYKNAPPTTFINSVLRSLEANKVSKEARDAVIKIALDTIPDKSFLQTARARKGQGRLGADEDFLAAFGTRARGMVRNFVADKYKPQLNKFENDVRDYVEKLKDYKFKSNTKNDVTVSPGDRVLVDIRHEAGGMGGDVYTYIGKQDKTMSLSGVDFSDKANWRPIDVGTVAEYAQEYLTRVANAKNPQRAMWSRMIQSANFSVTLAGNVSTVLIEMAQVPMFVFPMLWADYGKSNAARALGNSFKVLFGSGRTRKVRPLAKIPGAPSEEKGQAAFYSVLNYDFTRDKNGKLVNKDSERVEHIETLIRVAAPAGQFSRDIAYEVQGIADKGSLLDKVNRLSGMGLHYMGRIARETTLIAAYELELKKLLEKKSFRDATEEQKVAAAQKAIEVANFNYGSTAFGAASRLAQGDITSILTMYRHYNWRMYYLLFSYLRDARKSIDSAVRDQAKQKFVSTLGMTALFSGVQGLPLFGAMSLLYNMFADEDEDDFETVVRKGLGTTLYSGLGDALLGVQLSSRLGLPDLLFRDSISSADKTKLDLILEAVGGSVYGSAARMERGLKLISEGYADRGLEQVLPVPLANILKAYRYGTEGTMTLRGDPITGEVSYWNVAAQALGFAPADYIRQMEENAAKNKIIRGLGEARTKLYQRYFMALKLGDSDGAADVLADIIKFNERHPLYAITPEGIMSSVKERMRRSAETEKGVFTPKGMRAEIARLTADFNGEDEED